MFASGQRGLCIFLPVVFVEVDRQKETRFIQELRVYTHHEIRSTVVPPHEVRPDHGVGDWQILLVRTRGTLSVRFLADPALPFIPTCGRIPGLARCTALEAPRKDILPTAKERAEEGDLRLRR
jgi:hypothetical protein